MEFEWDDAKASENLRKHGVDFREAEEAFEDENAVDEFDDAHSSDEEHRFALIGLSSRRLLFVTYTIRRDTVVRIISARRATPRQERFYNHGKKS